MPRTLYYESRNPFSTRLDYIRRTQEPSRTAPSGLSLNQKKAIRRMVKSDRIKNFHETSVAAGTDILNTGVPLYDLTDMVQGDGEGERINDEVELTSLQYRFSIGTGAGATANVNYYPRLIFFVWRPDSAVDPPATADILESSSYLDLFPGDSAKRGKFKVVKDIQFRLVHDQSNTSVQKHGYIPVKKTIVKFNPSATTGRNKLYLLVISNTSTVNAVEWQSNFRVHYSEK